MENKNFYVYAHYRLDTMEPFYIGKGRNGRKDTLGRNPIHDNISEKHGHAVVILYDNLTEKEAFFYEREVIEDLVFNEGYEIPCKNCGEFTKEFSYLTNFSFGGEGQTGLKQSKETIEKRKASNKIASQRPETKAKRSLAQSGKNNAMYGKNAEDYMTPEAIAIKRERMKKAQSIAQKDPYTNKKRSETLKNRMKDPNERKKHACPGEKNGMSKPVYCIELDKEFVSKKEAIEFCMNNIDIEKKKIRQISNCCRGIQPYAGIYKGMELHWIFVNSSEYIKIKSNIKAS